MEVYEDQKSRVIALYESVWLMMPGSFEHTDGLDKLKDEFEVLKQLEKDMTLGDGPI